jgi:hypothetical protein
MHTDPAPVAAPVVFWLDRERRITEVNDAWEAFASSNGAPDLLRHRVLGAQVRSYVSGDLTRRYIDSLVDATLERVGRVDLPYRCDSPGERRYMRMEVAHEGGGVVRVSHHLLRSEPRHRPVLFVRDLKRSGQSRLRCSMCNLVACGEQWREAEFAGFPLHDGHLVVARVLYGICPRCAGALAALREGGPAARDRPPYGGRDLGWTAAGAAGLGGRAAAPGARAAQG